MLSEVFELTFALINVSKKQQLLKLENTPEGVIYYLHF